MDIQYVILGLLSWQPFSGYDLKKLISESDLFYWSGNNNQIYHSLVQLHQDGLVTQQVQYQESLPAKKIYSITEKGSDVLHEWAMTNPELPEVHHSFLIQLAWAESLSGAELDALLDKYEGEIAVRLQMQQKKAADLPEVPNRSVRERYLWQKIAENMRSALQNELDWVRQVRKDLQDPRFTG